MSQPTKPAKQSRTAKVAGYAAPVLGFSLLLGGTMLGFTYLSQSPSSSSPSAESNNQTQSNTTDAFLEPAANWQANNHVHGLAVNPENPQAIHCQSQWSFSMPMGNGSGCNPKRKGLTIWALRQTLTDSNRFYASGHPPTGGNLGFQVSENRGQVLETN